MRYRLDFEDLDMALAPKHRRRAEAFFDEIAERAIRVFSRAETPEEGLSAVRADMTRFLPVIVVPQYMEYAEAVVPAYARAAYDGLTEGRALRATDAELADLWLMEATAWVTRAAGVGIRGIERGTLLVIRQVLAEGFEEGLGVGAMAKILQERLPGFSPVRAERWVRTEGVAAANFASQAGARATGLEVKKTWRASLVNTRETHVEADGQTVGLDELFEVGGELADYPGDPGLSAAERVNCMCTTEMEGTIPE